MIMLLASNLIATLPLHLHTIKVNGKGFQQIFEMTEPQDQKEKEPEGRGKK